MGLFSGIEKASARKSNLNDTPGTYWQVIDSAQTTEARNKIPYVRIRKTVVRVIRKEPESLAVGQEPGDLIWPSDYFLDEVKTFLRGVLGLDAQQLSDLSEEETEQVFQENLCKGRVVEVDVYTKPPKMKKDGTMGKPFTVVDYKRPVSEDEILEHLDEETRKRFGLLQKVAA